MAVGHKLRFEIFKRDGFTCQYCGRKPPEVVLNIEHVLPQSRGGDDDSNNLLTSCRECNSGKSDNPLEESQLPSLETAERRRERIAQLEDFQRARLEEEKAIANAEKGLEQEWARRAGDHHDEHWFVPEKLPASGPRFIKMIGLESVYLAVELAFTKFPEHSSDPDYFNARFKYFCGVCWGIHRSRTRNGVE